MRNFVRDIGLACCALIVVVGCTTSEGLSGNTSAPHNSGLVLSTTKIDVGRVAPGSSVEATVIIRNTSSRLIIVKSVQTSCDCLSVRLSDQSVPPFGNMPVVLRIDMPAKDPFRGALALRAEGLDASGAELFSFEVDLAVVAPAHVL